MHEYQHCLQLHFAKSPWMALFSSNRDTTLLKLAQSDANTDLLIEMCYAIEKLPFGHVVTKVLTYGYQFLQESRPDILYNDLFSDGKKGNALRKSLGIVFTKQYLLKPVEIDARLAEYLFYKLTNNEGGIATLGTFFNGLKTLSQLEEYKVLMQDALAEWRGYLQIIETHGDTSQIPYADISKTAIISRIKKLEDFHDIVFNYLQICKEFDSKCDELVTQIQKRMHDQIAA